MLGSPRFVRRATIVAGLILLAGAAAFAVSFFGDETGDADAPVGTVPTEGAQVTDRAVPLAPEARTVAGRFILSAVTREDMATAWKLTDPQSEVRRCGERQCTYDEWLSGDVPIQPFPVSELDDAAFAIDESFSDSAVLEVALLPKDGSEQQGQIFIIALKRIGARWLVTYWAPRALGGPVPNSGEGSTH